MSDKMKLHEFSYSAHDLIIKLNDCNTTGRNEACDMPRNSLSNLHEETSTSTITPGSSAKNNPSVSFTAEADENDDSQGEKVSNHNRIPEDILSNETVSASLSTFDETLQTLWKEAQSKGLFRYTMKELVSKVLPGKFRFIAQLNPDRATKRREPQTIQSLQQPFNPNEFNFNKAKQEEFIMRWKPWWGQTVSNPTGNDDNHIICNQDGEDNVTDEESKKKDEAMSIEEKKQDEHFILINVSPLEYGHVLLTPFLTQNRPQKITFDGLRMAVEMLLLSMSRDFRVGFNSLCGYASVNHLHFHSYYLQHRLYTEYAELHTLAGPCKEIRNYPAPGFAFILSQADVPSLEKFIRDAFKLVSYLHTNDVAHNVFITRGSLGCSQGNFDAVRLFVWARKPSYGSKQCAAFNPALCELGGHFPIKTEHFYEILTEAFVSDELERICCETFTNVRQAVSALYE